MIRNSVFSNVTLASLATLAMIQLAAPAGASDFDSAELADLEATRIVRNADGIDTTVGYCTWRKAGRRVFVTAQISGQHLLGGVPQPTVGNSIITSWLLMPNEDAVQFDYALSSTGADGSFSGTVILPARSRDAYYPSEQSFTLDFRRHNAPIFEVDNDADLETELFTPAGIDGAAMIGTCTIPF